MWYIGSFIAGMITIWVFSVGELEGQHKKIRRLQAKNERLMRDNDTLKGLVEDLDHENRNLYAEVSDN